MSVSMVDHQRDHRYVTWREVSSDHLLILCCVGLILMNLNLTCQYNEKQMLYSVGNKGKVMMIMRTMMMI